MLLSSPAEDLREIGEAGLVLETTERFCSRTVRSITEKPEVTAGEADMRRVAAAAVDLGLLGIPEPDSLAVWGAPNARQRFSLSLQVLRTVARENAGVAYHLHNLALAGFLTAETRIEGISTPVPFLQGKTGTGKGALGKLLSGIVLDEDERNLAASAFPSPETPGWLQVAEPWDGIVLPLFDSPTGHIRWSAARRENCLTEVQPHAHGLNEAPVYFCSPFPSGEIVRSPLEPEESVGLFIAALGLQAAGLVAIAIGAFEGALAKALRYSRERKQGGRFIAEHHAVQLLLAEGIATAESLSLSLSGLTPPRSLQALDRILSLRAVAHPLCCSAGNAALQVFGGYGYMRDYGMEKIVRDLNHLRLLAMTPAEIRLYLAQRALSV